AVTGDPQMATLQAVFYPSLWMLARGLRRGLIWNLATAVGVTAGRSRDRGFTAGTLPGARVPDLLSG
ncbi:hypothetical protein, partial [Corynebacterium variabile]|uniref:hypothetical protein n=1 Tax=Corynebacterium variabile TaxID=1727 RepID=UPI00264967E9